MMERTRQVLKDLGNGLVMRRSTVEDADRLAEFNAKIHGEDPFDAESVASWTRDLLRVPPPGVSPADFVFVEDTGTGEIVSSMDLISQTWTYEGIPFGVGRPELVGTDPRYRNRGLVRAEFEVVHEWSRQRGEMVQVITGIPYFYRQFGYEMGLDLGGGRRGYEPQVPKLKEGEEEPYRFRPATAADLPLLMKLDQKECSRSMVAPVRDQTHWRNELFEKSKENINRGEVQVIETRDGQPVGCLIHAPFIWGTTMGLTGYQLVDGISFLAVTPSVIRYLWSTGQEYARAREKVLDSFAFALGRQHPAYLAAGKQLGPESSPYAYYVRVPDLPAFLQRIGPALEQRLIGTACEGHTGELKISFYRDGLRMQFERGSLVCVEPWKPKVKEDEGQAAFPNLTFLQLVFGYRTLAEIRQAYADCWVEEPDAQVVLETIFPKKFSRVNAIS